jgi:hypothetical protein
LGAGPAQLGKRAAAAAWAAGRPTRVGRGQGARRGPGGKRVCWAAGLLAGLGGGAAWEGGGAEGFPHFYLYFYLVFSLVSFIQIQISSKGLNECTPRQFDPKRINAPSYDATTIISLGFYFTRPRHI